MAGLLEAPEQLVEQHHLAAGEDDAVHGAAVHLLPAELLLRGLKQERVVAAPGGKKAFTAQGSRHMVHVSRLRAEAA